METIQDREAAGTATAEQDGMNGVVRQGENPFARVIGGFADDPLWDEFLQEMERSRREMDWQHGLAERAMFVLENGTA